MVVKTELSYLVAVLLIDLVVCILVDSTQCSASILLIAMAFFTQALVYVMLFYPSILPEKSKFFLELKHPIAIVFFVFSSFFVLYNGNLGTDTSGRTDSCPNTWLEYIK